MGHYFLETQYDYRPGGLLCLRTNCHCPYVQLSTNLTTFYIEKSLEICKDNVKQKQKWAYQRNMINLLVLV